MQKVADILDGFLNEVCLKIPLGNNHGILEEFLDRTSSFEVLIYLDYQATDYLALLLDLVEV